MLYRIPGTTATTRRVRRESLKETVSGSDGPMRSPNKPIPCWASAENMGCKDSIQPAPNRNKYTLGVAQDFDLGLRRSCPTEDHKGMVSIETEVVLIIV